VKDFLSPWNVIRLSKLDRSYQETDTLMEETILFLLQDFFHGQQPFHMVNDQKYERKPTVARHRELFERLYAPAKALKAKIDAGEIEAPTEETDFDAAFSLLWLEKKYHVFSELLDILEWYEAGGHNKCGTNAFLQVLKHGGSVDEAVEAERATDAEKTRKLLFVVEHRNILWT
jgi:hypothetical protein